MKKFLTVKGLKDILSGYNDDLPVVITREGKGHQYGIKATNIYLIDHPYFGNDPEAETEIGEEKKYLNIGDC